MNLTLQRVLWSSVGAFAISALASCGGGGSDTTVISTPTGTVLALSTVEPAGANCASGGTRVDAGADTNGNNVLDTVEIIVTSYICSPTPLKVLTRSSVEPSGTNCANGGTKIEAGTDANANSVLDTAEVTATSYVCGTLPANVLSKLSAEPAGARCTAGGARIDSGADTNGNGALDDAEILASTYVCGASVVFKALGGSVSGLLAGNSLQLQRSSSSVVPDTFGFSTNDSFTFPTETLSVSANGTFSFSAQQLVNSPYGLSIVGQPAGQNCTSIYNAGIANAAAVDMQVLCGAVLGGRFGSSTVASMQTSRLNHASTLLADGRVLVSGGFSGTDFGERIVPDGVGNTLASAEIFNPSTGAWTSTGNMSRSRFGHTSTLLTNGKVLVVGGASLGGLGTTITELYDPSSGTWSSAGNTTKNRANHTATLLPNGKVVVIGGGNAQINTATSLVEVYDPATGLWADGGTVSLNSVSNHTATLLPNGKVLVVSPNGTAAQYDPATATSHATGGLAATAGFHTATLLPNGKVLVVGGFQSVINGGTLFTQLYDPATGTWANSGDIGRGSRGHTAMLLPSGKVLVLGGQGANGAPLSSNQLYDPTTGTWAATGSMGVPRALFSATLLPSGKVLVMGGASNTPTNAAGYDSVASAELYE
jgi:hypothetical protein